MDFDWLREHQSGLGTAAVIVMDQSTDLVKAIWRLSKFYKHESCGQCTPCREGLKQMLAIYDDIVEGRGRPGDIERIERLASGMQLGSLCELGKSAPNR